MGQWFNGPGQDLATVAHETGYPVVEVDGWRNRGHGPLDDYVGVIVCHHTAGADPEETEVNFPSLQVVRDGRAGLDGPLSHYGIGFDGTVYVIAAGNAWHAGSGGWHGMSGNEVALGIEAEDAGDGDWTREQLDVYPRLCAALCQFLGIGADGVAGHKEWAPNRKIDPAGINMDQFRVQVAHYLAHPETINRDEDIDMADVQALMKIVREYLPSGEAYGYTIPRSPDRMRTFAAGLSPKRGVVAGNAGYVYLTLQAGEQVQIDSVTAIEDWTADGEAGTQYPLQGPYTLQPGDRQSFTIPGAATQVHITYQSDVDFTAGIEIDPRYAA